MTGKTTGSAGPSGLVGPWRDHYSGTVTRKAEDLLMSGGVVRLDDDWIGFRVKGSRGRKYKVQVLYSGPDAVFITCGCPNGTALGGLPQCYHSAAVLMAVQNVQSSRYGVGLASQAQLLEGDEK